MSVLENTRFVCTSFLIFLFLSAGAQKSGKPQVFALDTLNVREVSKTEIFIIKDNGKFLLFKLNRSLVGPNSGYFDLYLLNKENRQLKRILAFEDMRKQLVTVDKFQFKGDSVYLLGSFFSTGSQRNKYLEWVYYGDNWVKQEEFNDHPYPVKADSFEYFPGFACLGHFGDSTFAFADKRIYSRISPAMGVYEFKYFIERKFYTYDYKAGIMQELNSPPLPDTGMKKVHEEVFCIDTNFKVLGLYQLHAKKDEIISGVYFSDVRQGKISFMPVRDEINGKKRGIDSKLSWNQEDFLFSDYRIHAFELANDNFILAAYNDQGLLWTHIIFNRCNTGPYPQMIKHNESLISLVYGAEEGFYTIQGREHSCGVMFVKMNKQGESSFYKDPGLGNEDEYLLYEDSLFSLNDKQVALFFTNRKNGILSMVVIDL